MPSRHWRATGTVSSGECSGLEAVLEPTSMQGSSATTRAKAGGCRAMPITDLKPQSMEVESGEVRSGSDGFRMNRNCARAILARSIEKGPARARPVLIVREISLHRKVSKTNHTPIPSLRLYNFAHDHPRRRTRMVRRTSIPPTLP
jgi:hypothetical protein